MKVSVQYSTMIVKDMEKSVEFYRDILGFRESYHVDTPDGGSITIMKSDGGASVELIENERYDVGLYSVPAVATSVGRMAFVLDPSGVRICLIEHSDEYKEKYM